MSVNHSGEILAREMQENVTCKVAGLYKPVGERGSSGIIHHSLKETARAVIRGQEGPDRDRHPI